MILSVHQPQYLPWLGYFDKVARSDRFVFLDLPQYKKREFQNRNRIKGPDGEIWLAVPVLTKGKFDQPIKDVAIDNTQDWQKSHWQTLSLHLKKAPHWERYAPGLQAFYQRPWERLSDLNVEMTAWFFAQLGVATPWQMESALGTTTQSTERLIELCRKTGTDAYLSGSGGKAYMDESRFAAEKLGLKYQHYEHPTYAQRYGGFLPYMSVVDLLMNAGPDSLQVLLSGGGPC